MLGKCPPLGHTPTTHGNNILSKRRRRRRSRVAVVVFSSSSFVGCVSVNRRERLCCSRRVECHRLSPSSGRVARHLILPSLPPYKNDITSGASNAPVRSMTSGQRIGGRVDCIIDRQRTESTGKINNSNVQRCSSSLILFSRAGGIYMRKVKKSRIYTSKKKGVARERRATIRPSSRPQMIYTRFASAARPFSFFP